MIKLHFKQKVLIIVTGEWRHSGTTEVNKTNGNEADEEDGQTTSQGGLLEGEGEPLRIQVNHLLLLLLIIIIFNRYYYFG